MGGMLPSAVLTHCYSHDEDCDDDHHCHLIASSSEDSRCYRSFHFNSYYLAIDLETRVSGIFAGL